jgi:hypothetical protein
MYLVSRGVVVAALLFSIAMLVLKVLQAKGNDQATFAWMIVACGILSYSIVVSRLDARLIEERLDLLRSLFVEGVVNSGYVYKESGTIEQAISRIREVVTKNTRIKWYNEKSIWDFDELLAECLSGLRRDIDFDLRADVVRGRSEDAWS